MNVNNAQTFSQDSDQYARSRPQYPDELFSYLSGLCEGHDRAWDCATGNGQAAVSCAKYFSHVEATDVSAEQIQHGIQHSRVRYGVSPAEQTTFVDNSFDLIMVATAVHWFDQPKFFREVERVLRPNGVLAVWGYAFFKVEPQVDDIIEKYLLAPIEPYWAEGNRQVMAGYPDLILPFEEIPNPRTFSITVQWNLEQFISYTRTWSAVKRCMVQTGNDPVQELESRITAIWPKGGIIKTIHMPLSFKAARKPSQQLDLLWATARPRTRSARQRE